ncbi:MAG: hypothetical protein GY716_25625 [bacterium]|nr:hypothetical protein [bacterium]
MAAPAPFTDKELAFLQALEDEGVEYLVVGLAAAALQGAPAVTQDIDLWFRDLSDPGVQSALRSVGATYIPPGSNNPPLIVGGGADLFDLVVHMRGLRSFSEERSQAVRIRLGSTTVPVLPLDRIIASKKATDRPKDRAILPVLEDCLKVQRKRKT